LPSLLGCPPFLLPCKAGSGSRPQQEPNLLHLCPSRLSPTASRNDTSRRRELEFEGPLEVVIRKQHHEGGVDRLRRLRAGVGDFEHSLLSSAPVHGALFRRHCEPWYAVVCPARKEVLRRGRSGEPAARKAQAASKEGRDGGRQGGREGGRQTSKVMALGCKKMVLDVSATVLYLRAKVSGSVFQSPSTCSSRGARRRCGTRHQGDRWKGWVKSRVVRIGREEGEWAR
jgi:hypothetical protein